MLSNATTRSPQSVVALLIEPIAPYTVEKLLQDAP